MFKSIIGVIIVMLKSKMSATIVKIMRNAFWTLFSILGIAFLVIGTSDLFSLSFQFGTLLVLIFFVIYYNLFLWQTNLKKTEKVREDSRSREERNNSLIETHNIYKENTEGFNEPNYSLAREVFLDFNEWQLDLLDRGLIPIYSKYIPKSLLPYPKNYIKYAYYLFLEEMKKDNKMEYYRNARSVGSYLFNSYPDYEQYKKNLAIKKRTDEIYINQIPQPRETFKELFGVYEVSEEDYNNSPSSIDSTDEKLMHDFGCLIDIEEDIRRC